VGGIVTAGVGIAATALGLVLNLRANTLADEASQHYSRSKASTQASYQTFAWVGYGVGAAAIIAGVTMYVIGLEGASSQSAPAVAVSPVLTPDAAGMVVGGVF
jgi:hypothetical protein